MVRFFSINPGRRSKISWIFLAIVLLFAANTVVTAEEKPSGTITIEQTSVSIGIGIDWGEGTLTMNDGTKHKFSLNGMKMVGAGVSKISAAGEVYNLKSLADFPGTYTAAEAGLTIAGGWSGVAMKNQHDVVIKLRAKEKGLGMNLGPKGVTIVLKD